MFFISGCSSEIPVTPPVVQTKLSETAKMLTPGDVWSFRGEESQIKISVADKGKLSVSIGNPYLQIKEQNFTPNLADTILAGSVTDSKGAAIKVQLEYKENKFFATVTNGQGKAWGPIPLRKNAPARPVAKNTEVRQIPAKVDMEEVARRVSATISEIHGNKNMKYVRVLVENNNQYTVNVAIRVQFSGTNAKYNLSQFEQPSGSEWARNVQAKSRQEIEVTVPHSFSQYAQVNAVITGIELAR